MGTFGWRQRLHSVPQQPAQALGCASSTTSDERCTWISPRGPINVLSICYTRGRTRLHHSRHRDAPPASGSDLFSFALTSSRGFQPAGSTVP